MFLYCCVFSLTLIYYCGPSPVLDLGSSVMQEDFPDFKNYFKKFDDVIGEDKKKEAEKKGGDLATRVDFSKLPPNYHNQTEEEKKVGNRTIYRKKEIHKVTDNKTGDLLMSEKTITSIAEEDGPVSEGLKNTTIGDQPTKKEKGGFLISWKQKATSKLLKKRTPLELWNAQYEGRRRLIPRASEWFADTDLSMTATRDHRHPLMFPGRPPRRLDKVLVPTQESHMPFIFFLLPKQRHSYNGRTRPRKPDSLYFLLRE